jgi:hypothetical protein
MSELLEHEREVEISRAKLSEDLAVLCSPETFANFTEDLKQEAFDTRDVLWEKIKARAASNPAAVIAIGAGLAWRLLQRPPIASALIGVGLFSLWKTQPKTAFDSAGRRLNYMEQSKEALKEQAGRGLTMASNLTETARASATARGSEVLEGAKEKMRQWQEEVDNAVGETSSRLKASGEDLLSEIRAKQHDLRDEIKSVALKAADKMRDDDNRNTLLLGVAGVAIAAALGIACQKRISETAMD